MTGLWYTFFEEIKGDRLMGNGQLKKVFVAKVAEYDESIIKSEISAAFSSLGVDLSAFVGKKVVIKPNFIMKMSPDAAATTNPAVIGAVVSLLNDAGIRPVIAESPGGVYSAARLSAVYRTVGIADFPEKYDCELNLDVSKETVNYPDGKTTKTFEIIKPIADADVIFDVCKLKSHSLTKMSAATKNLYGTVPGLTKFELHAAYPDIGDFSSMLCDLASMICEKKTVIAVTDAIIGMEGEGPTGGSPKKIGALLVSESVFASDVVAAKILGMDVSTVLHLSEAVSRGLVPADINGTDVLGASPEEMTVSDFVLPRSQNVGVLEFFSKGKMGELFRPRPYVTKTCRACGECVRSCPQHTIELSGGRARINAKKCIRCFCCQELCPFKAIKTRRNPILNVISKIK